MIILYCEKCGKRVDEKDLATGQAQVDAQNHATCAACAPPRRKDSHRALMPAAPAGKSPSTRIIQAPGKTVALHDSKASAPPRSNLLIIGAGIIGSCVLIFLSVWYFGLRETTSMPKGGASVPKTPASASTTPTVPNAQPSVPASATPGTSRSAIGTPTTPQSPQTSQTPAGSSPDEKYDPRAMIANSLLLQAKDYHSKFPHSPWIYKEKLEDLIKNYRDTPAGIEAATLVREGNFPERPPSKGTDSLPDEAEWRKAVELLPSADPGQDTLRNGWSRKGDLLISSDLAWMTLPYMPSEEYDLRMVFVRRSGNEAFCINLPRRDRACTFIMCAWGDVGHGFELLQGRRVEEQPGYAPRPGLVLNGKTYVLTIQVRREVLKAYLDGQLFAEAKASWEESLPHDEWKLPRMERLAIGSYFCTYEVRSLRVLDWAEQAHSFARHR